MNCPHCDTVLVNGWHPGTDDPLSEVLACREIVKTQRDAKHAALEKINSIRCSIVGMQGFNFSEHAYPLVAALDAAGYESPGYEINRKNLGTLIEQAQAADTARDEARAERDELRELLIERTPSELVCLAEIGCPSCGEGMTARLGTELKFARDEARAERDELKKQLEDLVSAVRALGAEIARLLEGDANRYHQSLGAKWMCEAIVREMRTRFAQNRSAQEFASHVERKWEEAGYWRPKS